MDIDYRLIADAVEFYQARGYQPVEVPWLLPKDAVEATIPAGLRVHETFAGCLPGSGEQSFVQLMKDRDLRCGKYLCVTPCFRDEPVLDDLHRAYFLKVELLGIPQYGYNIHTSAAAVLNDAVAFFLLHVPSVRIVQFGDSSYAPKDILSPAGTELGSYGIRDQNGLNYAYGTGCAEPRLSQARREPRVSTEILPVQKA